MLPKSITVANEMKLKGMADVAMPLQLWRCQRRGALLAPHALVTGEKGGFAGQLTHCLPWQVNSAASCGSTVNSADQLTRHW